MPELSIIVPIYNVEKYLSRCIDSVLNQSYKDFELILVNDGSTDSCEKICNEYKIKDYRVIVINKENGGVSSARNAGINIAKGKYLGFIDPDDFINGDMYKILVDSLKKNDSDIIICDYHKFYEEDSYKYDENKSVDENIEVENINNIEAIDKLLKEGEKFIMAWNKVYKRHIFDSLRYKEGVIYEDEQLAHEILYKSGKISIINTRLYFYVQRKGSIVNSPYSIKKFDKVYAIKDRCNFLKIKGLNELQQKSEKSFVDYFIWNYFVAYQRLDNVNRELNLLKREFNSGFSDILVNKKISNKEKLTLSMLYVSPYLYNKVILRKQL